MKSPVKAPKPAKKTTPKSREVAKKPTFIIDKTEKAVADVVIEIQSKKAQAKTNTPTLVHRVTTKTSPDREFFNQESIDIVAAAKTHFKSINEESCNDFGVFNSGFILTKGMIAELKKVPDFQGVLICLAAFSEPDGKFIKYEDKDLPVNSLIFPVFRVVTSEGITEDFWCPAVPGCFPPPSQDGTIYWCPPLNPCPRKP
jgi:hypothetical protein